MLLKKENRLFSNSTNVRIGDISYGNHLCHTKLITLIHNTRALFLKSHNLSEDNCFNVGLIMLSVNIDYRSQCFFDDVLEISIHLEKIEKVKVEFSYTVINKTTNKLAANATTLMGFFDYKNQKLVKAPKEFEELRKLY